ncbi:MAG TPA: choice-of-anchor Q domain-containing protein [Gammaproteobacteria bacterium]
MANVQAAATSFTLNVVDHAGNPVNGFRWLVEEDTTFAVTPGVHTTQALALGFHTSHNPVVKEGETTTASSVVVDGVDDTKRYFVSVLPIAGYSNGGAEVSFGAAATTVVVAQNPIPTAQISVFAYEDKQPINNAPDLPQEPGLPGFNVLLFDPAGQYGIAGGQVSKDAFGNPLGTTYNADGSVATLGSGVIVTDADGVAHIKNLAPGKYGVQIVPPAGQNWIQTHTIEGTHTIDAWVKANEPSYFTEFGPPGHHVFIGFIRSFDCFTAGATAPAGYCDGAPTPGTSTVSGRIVNQHMSRPPDYAMFNGQPFPGCWIGLNDGTGASAKGIYARPCNGDSTFTINNVAPGNYNLVVWDNALDIIFATVAITVPDSGDLILGDVPVFNWNHRSEHTVFFDSNQNGFHDPGEPTLGENQSTINLRFRDGRIYDSRNIDPSGEAPFDEVFPFFNWLVAEVDYTKLKPTGVTVTVDNGGAVVPGEVLNPQPQNCTQADINAGNCTTLGAPLINPNTGDNLSRTETGPVLLEAFQGFLGQTNRFEWGKANYGPGENGGITGIVHYAVTRAENDPAKAVAEQWEPGIPRIQVNLYADNGTGGIVDQNGDGIITPPDVDNYPLGNFPGPEDVDNNVIGTFDLGDALRVAHTDSFDDSHPTGCQGDVYSVDGVALDCYDGLRNFNQVRPGVFDGGYAFGSANPADAPLPAGNYIVEVAVPNGYKIIKEEDKNVEIGDAYTPAPLMLPPVCVGDPHTVPAYLSLQTDDTGTPYPGIAAADLIAAPFAGMTRSLCDRKQIRLSQGQNAAVDFFLFTETPKAAMVQGFILNDLGNEFNPNSPNFGEKYAPPWLPVSFRDWTGKEIARVHADEWGLYNAVLPSTYNVHIPMPSGVSPNMITACMNDAGPIPNPAYDAVNNPNVPQTIVDPYYDRRYSQFCYTFQYMPGATTYLDTPVLPIAAFTGAGSPLDCEQPDGAPLVHAVTGPNGSGPLVNEGETLTIIAVGDMSVPNPAYDGVTVTNPTITRHYGFGNGQGTITLGGIALTNVNWSDGIITATVPTGAVTGQLAISRADGVSAPSGVTVTVGPLPKGVTALYVQPDPTPGATPIQNAIDLAGPSDLIIVAPGTYDELVVMYKPVRLQGWGAYSTIINSRKAPAEKLQKWRNKVNTLLSVGAFDLLPGQTAGFNAPDNEPILFVDGEGAGISVFGKNSGLNRNRFRNSNNARIDGFTITGGDQGGAIFVNGYAHYLEMSNNRLIGNQGTYGGGIRVGHADLVSTVNNVTVYTDAGNDNINIHNNEVTENGSTSGAGGGIALYTGAGSYQVNANYVCGNFTSGNGGGIGHLGLSDKGLISNNSILFNQSFNQGLNSYGGGIYIGGQAPLAGAGTVSPGAGNVVIDGNLIQANQAGAGDGGGISLQQINGGDVLLSPRGASRWNSVEIFNNLVVNNVAGYAAGGIAMADALRVVIEQNTVAHNDSTATAGAAFVPGNPNQSLPQPAGIVSRAHSDALNALIPAGANFDAYRNFSNPELVNNIIWQNRSFYWFYQGNVNNPEPATFGLVPNIAAGDAAVYSDLAVLGYAGQLAPRNCLLTDATGYPGNVSGDPGFALGYFNGDSGQTVQQTETTSAMSAQPAFDEGGNFIDVRFGPLTPGGNYHLNAGSPAIDAGDSTIIDKFIELTVDYDGAPRPQGTAPDIGADEVAP